MSIPSPRQKQYSSALKRLLPATIANFFDVNFPKFFGPAIRDQIATAIINLVEEQLPAYGHLRPGQCLWNAVAIDTRADSQKLRLVPVVLTLVHADDITQRSANTPLKHITQAAIARMLEEAYQQGALLSMRDLALLTWHSETNMTHARQAWETQHARPLPHPGTLQDMGTCITHKTAIVVKAVYEKKSTRLVAQETRHTQQAVDRYLRDFYRVRTCYRQNPDQDFICQVTGMSAHLVTQYLHIIQTHEVTATGQPSEASAILNIAGAEDRATLGSDPSAAQACRPSGDDTMTPHHLGIQNKAKNPTKNFAQPS